MHLNPHAKCRSSEFNLKLFKERKTGVTYNLETHFFISIYMVLYSTDSHRSIPLKLQEGNGIWHKTLRMLKFHPIPEFMKTYTNFKKNLWLTVFWLKYNFRIKFKIPILDLMLLPKTVFHLKGSTPVVVLTSNFFAPT